MIPDNVKKYLNKYGERKWALTVQDDKKYEAAVVVPALDEYENLKTLLLSLSECGMESLSETLVIIVVNNVKDCPENVRVENRKTLEYLKNIAEGRKTGDNVIDKVIDSRINLGFVDMSTRGLEMDNKTGGVGTARKTGMDLALSNFDYSSSEEKIIICLDADCTVENNYLNEIISHFNSGGIMAAHVNYEHPLPDDYENKLAIICYEIFLRYYVMGLEYAASPFAIHTVGSTMICTAEAYISVQGMNKRKAAEDFYFMEKLAKLYTVHSIDSTSIYPSGRGSWRVPFGTGQRVNRFLSHERNEYELYSPESFMLLKEWNEFYYDAENRAAGEYLDFAGILNVHLRDFLVDNGFQKSLERIRQNAKTEQQLLKQKKMWFDGFRTLKLIHYLRDTAFPNEQMFSALDRMFELKNINPPITVEADTIPDIEHQFKYLEIMRART